MKLNKIFAAMIFCVASLSFSQKGFAQITANFSIAGSNVVCQGNSAAFMDQSTGNPVSWKWIFQGAIPDTSYQQNPVVQYFVPGPHDVTLIVTDAGGNADTLTMTGYIFVDFFMISETHVHALCGSNIGSITTTVTGGTAPYQYSWNGGYTTPNLTNLTAGTYTLFVVDAMGCMQQITVVIQSLGSFSLGESHWDATCGNSDGIIDLTPQGGVNPFTYIWSNGATTEDQSTLSAGIYDVTVTDSFTCAIAISVIIGNTNGPQITSTVQAASCGNANGNIDMTATGGVPPYTYIWSNGATTEDINLLSYGFYNVTVTDQNLCIGIASISVSDSNVLSVSGVMSSPLCGNQGNIVITTNGGTLPYTYLWNNGATTNSISNVPAGFYMVTVSEASGCSLVESFNAVFYSYVFISAVTPNCGNNGSLTATSYGGISPFIYAWSNGQNTQSISSLAAGFYTVTITDSAGCNTTGEYNLLSSCYNVIEGYVFNDLNGNCFMDSGESVLSGATISATSGSQNFYGFSNASGYYNVNIGVSGNFTLSATLNNNSICGNVFSCTGSSNVFFPSVGDTSTGNNFGFVGSTGFDLNNHPGWSTANPGFQKEYWVMPFNQSPTAFTDTATVIFFYDSNLIYDYSLAPIPVHDAVAHSLTWLVPNVPAPTYDWNNRFRNFFTVPASLPVSYLLQSDFYTYPMTGDCDSANNHLHYSEVVTGSHDPNAKEVSPSGNIMNDDSVLTYTIHFQNTGTDTTNFIFVTDTLSQFVDPTTVQNLASSHPYESFTISGVGILTWLFNPIELVDSATNEPASKGFITFNIKQKPNLPLGTVISNTASIYFDYNSPVQTNTVVNTLYNSVNNISAEKVSASSYPNPFSESTTIVVNGMKGAFDFTINNVLGMKMNELKNVNTSQFNFKRNDLPAGIYFYSISVEGKNLANGKLVIE